MKYNNAGEILPESLINEIRKYYPFGLLWIPKVKASCTERDMLIVELVKNHVPVNEVAKLAELTPRHVRRVSKKHSVCE